MYKKPRLSSSQIAEGELARMAFRKNLVTIIAVLYIHHLAGGNGTIPIKPHPADWIKSIPLHIWKHLSNGWRTYQLHDNAEKERHLAIFVKNLLFVENFNKQGNKTYKLSLNLFSDMTSEEFLGLSTYWISNFQAPNIDH